MAANLYELEQGAVVSPLHFHHVNEELLFVLAGTPTLRRGAEDERVLAPGEVVSFPAGPAGVHQVLNRATEPARVLITATNEVPEVAEQVENEQLAVITADGLRLLPLSAPITADGGDSR
ncbi:MAG: cupin domain-containing protein [Solirubrobacteraceae bacterium]